MSTSPVNLGGLHEQLRFRAAILHMVHKIPASAPSEDAHLYPTSHQAIDLDFHALTVGSCGVRSALAATAHDQGVFGQLGCKIGQLNVHLTIGSALLEDVARAPWLTLSAKLVKGKPVSSIHPSCVLEVECSRATIQDFKRPIVPILHQLPNRCEALDPVGVRL